MSVTSYRTFAKNPNKVIPAYLLAAIIRLWLMHSEYQTAIANRAEVSTSINSWKSVKEGTYLQENGIDPYSGDTFHENPIHLYIYKYLMKYGGAYLEEIFVAADIITGHVLYLVAKEYAFQLSVVDYKVENSRARKSDSIFSPKNVLLIYLFNPYSILSCVGFTTTTLSNFVLSLYLYAFIKGSFLLSCIVLSICILQSIYPIVLLVPLFLACLKQKNSLITPITYTVVVLVLFTCFLFACYMLTGSSTFIKTVYGFVFNFDDIKPNIGIFWYFFMEIFDHYKNLFICSFQINTFIMYVPPLSFLLKNDIFLLTGTLLFITNIFKPYPCIGDVGFILALLQSWSHLHNYMQFGFLIVFGFVMCTALAPILWHLWMYARSANANFYFGVNLGFTTVQVALLCIIVLANVKRRLALKYGLTKNIDGKDVDLAWQ